MRDDRPDAGPVMSVVVLAYNQVAYIRDCLDSILRQETDFPFEICLGEDGSTDGTREICQAYAVQYPERITLILHARAAPGRENYFSQGNYNYVETLKHCRGKYIADCDGDDYWLDPKKLQKQYEVFERDPSIVLVHSDYALVNSDSCMSVKSFYASGGIRHDVQENRSAFLYDVLTNAYPIRTCTVVMRASAVQQALAACGEDLKRIPMADVPMWCEVLRIGQAAYIPESLAAYRCLEESACNSNSPLAKVRFVNRAADWGLLLGKRCDLPMTPILEHKIKTANRYAIVSGDCAEIRRLHADHGDLFSSTEEVIYRMNGWRPLRRILLALFLRTYRRTQKAVRRRFAQQA